MYASDITADETTVVNKNIVHHCQTIVYKHAISSGKNQHALFRYGTRNKLTIRFSKSFNKASVKIYFYQGGIPKVRTLKIHQFWIPFLLLYALEVIPFPRRTYV